MKYISKLGVALSMCMLFVNAAQAATMEEITAVDNGHVITKISSDVSLAETVDADVIVYKDLLATYAYKNPDEQNKVVINLTYEMNKGVTYNVLGVEGTDINIDFTVPNEIPGEVIIENNDAVEKVNVVDAKTLEIYYKNELSADTFTFKVLRDIGTQSMQADTQNMLQIGVKNPLEESASYLLVVNSFKDSQGSSVDFSEVFYEFNTPDSLEMVLEPQNLDAANDPSYALNKEKQSEKGNVEEVAAKAKQTPQTGAATWILILATLGISTFFFIKRK